MSTTADFSSGLFTNFVLSLLLRKIIVPAEFHDQCSAVKELLADDITGLADSLTDFAVHSASVRYNIETGNKFFNDKLNYWLENINKDYNGQFPRGVNELAKEYFKERWKGSSFPVLKILKWAIWDGIMVPSQMVFVDGQAIYAKTENQSEIKSVGDYTYYIGNKLEPKEALTKGVVLTKPFSRWFDKYPTPFLIKRGIYHNFKIIQSLKSKQTEILEQIIPYLLLIKKGDINLATKGIKVYSDDELANIKAQFQDFMDEMRGTNVSHNEIKSPIRVSQFDEDIKHLIPDLNVIFNKDLFVVAERNILSGLGFIDVIEATSTSRKESILNPKVFIEDVKMGVNDFKNHILRELVAQIIEKNTNHRKYVKNTFNIVSSPIVGFMSDDFKNLIKQLYTYGKISAQTAVELIAEISFETEVYRREKEREDGIEEKMYPQIIQNQEGQGTDISGKPTPEEDENNKKIPEDKREPVEKEKYKNATEIIEDIEDLNGSPYTTIKELPPNVKKLTIKEQRKWMSTFNSAYYYKLGKTNNKKEAETYAFAVAWSIINKNNGVE